MMTRIINIITGVLIFASVALVSYAAYLFLKFNSPIIKNIWLMGIAIAICLLGIAVLAWFNISKSGRLITIVNLAISLMASGFMVYVVLKGAVLNYFQPYSLYDRVIYVSIAGFAILILVLLTQASISLFTSRTMLKYPLTGVIICIFLLVFVIYGNLQKDFDYTNISSDPLNIFEAGEGDYGIFRIPSIISMPKGSKLKNGHALDDDLIIVLAEARRNGSLDDGDIDLVMKKSPDGGKSWSELIIVKTWKDGTGKIGNATPVFNTSSGELYLLYIAGPKPSEYKTYLSTSADGGVNWIDKGVLYDGIVGPGHGIEIVGGQYDERLVVPVHGNGGPLTLYSDDGGSSWETGEMLLDGNESEIAQINEQGDLIMVVRTNKPVAKPHDPLEKIYAISSDGGETWSVLKIMENVKEPICMSSIISGNGNLYYSYPDDYFSRSRMSIAKSINEGESWTVTQLIYAGPSGYSDMALMTNGNVALVFENGAVEYDERITFVLVEP